MIAELHEKQVGVPTSKKAIEKAEGRIEKEASEYIDAENMTDTDKGILKVLVDKYKLQKGQSFKNVETVKRVVSEMRTFAKWLNTQKNKDGSPKTLADANQALFNDFIGEKTYSAIAKRRYQKGLDYLELDIDVSGVKETIKKERIVLTTSEFKKMVSKTDKSLKGDPFEDIQLSPQKKISKGLARVVSSFKSWWGHRDVAFKRGAKFDKEGNSIGGTTIQDVFKGKDCEPLGIWMR